MKLRRIWIRIRKNLHQSGGGRLEDPTTARGNDFGYVVGSGIQGDSGGRIDGDIGIPDIGSISYAIPVIWSIGYMVIPDTWVNFSWSRC